ncbi:hypothetical protein FKN01_02820 [Streptomyces sp. 130]|uniref:hypothetical protein n=1 Tax=Streptomyces sp. 130 TaxID=2591006 RepID=UPI00117CB40E|nr:hypothetical protein [Streptomyces sp. 130]TRV81414.1 hypothetical protein FKN01_02820 [Streptomyces sp. 130]
MIASTPVARWTWGRHNRPGQEIIACFNDLLTAWYALAKNRLVSGVPHISARVSEAGRSNTYLFKETFELDKLGPDTEQDLTAQVKASLRPGEIGSVYAHIECPGIIIDASHEVREEKVFLIGSSAFLDYVSTDLVTYSDAWMPYDLAGRAQPTIHAANAPRLSAALIDLSQGLHAETDPDDPTYFGQPTETGVDNFLREDGSSCDVWSSFEIPYRYNEFTHAPGFGSIGYKRSTDGEVQYVPVLGEQGRLIGYLWASDAEGAAGFEPQDVGDDETYRAGRLWLTRLRTTHDRGLTPSEALRQLARLPDEDGSGHVDATVAPRHMHLDALRELTRNS